MRKNMLIVLLIGCITVYGGLFSNIDSKSKIKKVTVWHTDYKKDQVRFWQNIVKRFEESRPDVSVTIKSYQITVYKNKMKSMILTDNSPDLFRDWGGGWMHQCAEAGLLRDITAETASWPSAISKGAKGVYSHKGKVYGIPYDLGAIGFWYNKELFKKAECTVPKTWDGLLGCINKLKAKDIVPIALGERDKWPGHFWWVYLAMRIGGKEAFEAIDTGNGTFNDEPFVRAGQLLQQLTVMNPFQPTFMNDRYPVQARMVGNGKAAMELMGQWAPDAQKGEKEN